MAFVVFACSLHFRPIGRRAFGAGHYARQRGCARRRAGGDVDRGAMFHGLGAVSADAEIAPGDDFALHGVEA